MNASKRAIVAGGMAALSVFAFESVTQGAMAPSGAESLAVRKAVMRSIVTHFGAIKGAIASGDQNRIKAAAGHAMAINWLSTNIPTVTPKGSGQQAGKSRALPKIWEDWAGYKKAAAGLTTESGKLAAALKTGDAKAAMAQFANTGKIGCGGCHRFFRAKKK